MENMKNITKRRRRIFTRKSKGTHTKYTERSHRKNIITKEDYKSMDPEDKKQKVKKKPILHVP